MNIFIRQGEIYSEPLEYLFLTLGKNKKELFLFTKEKGIAEIIADHQDPTSIPICVEFYYNLLCKRIFNWNFYFKKKLEVRSSDGREDHLALVFYMVNSLQEYEAPSESMDEIGRFKYDSSYQKEFGCIEENLVQKHFDLFCKENTPLSHLSQKATKTKVFISHDIDTIYGSLLEDGLWAFKRGRFDIILKLLLQSVLLRPDWINMDKIVKINGEYDLKSTFFWLVNKGKGIGNIKNADYQIKKVKNIISKIESNGLHKSCSDDSFENELAKLPVSTCMNRYHFLKFQIPHAWQDIELSAVKFDASLGFSERYGFRNNYGMPFQPYNISDRKRYGFIEVPLNLMDGTFHRSMKINKNKTAETIIRFFEKNNKNCILSLLWHNIYFTNYKYQGYLEEYKKILTYFFETRIQCISPSEIINEYHENK